MYLHINKINGKIYVGITCQNLHDRWRDGLGYRKCIAFWRAIEKYGWDNFDHEVFSSSLTKEEAENMEVLLIQKLQTQNKDYGYNIMGGGSSSVLTDETKRKISESHMGILNPMFGSVKSEEEKEHLRQMMIGENNPRYGVVLTKETRKKISESLKGRHLSQEHKDKISKSLKGVFKGRARPEGGGRAPRKILCVETGEEYGSVADAARAKGVPVSNKSNISGAAKKGKTAYGYHWKYL